MKNIAFVFLIVLIMSCSGQINNQTHLVTNYEQLSNNPIMELKDLFGLWRNEGGIAREISEGEIKASGDGWSFTWRIDSVTAVKNNDEATKDDYPYGFTFSGEVTVFNGSGSVLINIGFGSGNGLGEIYSETYYLHTSEERFLANSPAGIEFYNTTFYSRRLLNSEERFIHWGMDYGIVSNTTIIAENAAIHAYPSKSSNVLFELPKGTWVRILSTSNRMDSIDGHIGNWIEVVGNYPLGGGWVFSRYIEAEQIIPSELRIIGLEPRREGRVQRLIASYEVNGIETIVYLWQNREAEQDFHIFVFDRGITINTDDGRTLGLFHYRNIPGTYAWFPETGELRHITYMGSTAESAWVIFTDDFRFMLQDFGTGPGVRGLVVRRVEDNELIYSGGYWDSINLRGNTINVANRYNSWNIPYMDSETIYFAENFIANNPVPENVERYREWFGIELVIIYELNLDTGVRQIVDGIWVNTQ
jgi:hypothetical protein